MRSVVGILGYIFLALLIAFAATVGSLVEHRWKRAALWCSFLVVACALAMLLVRSHHDVVTRVNQAAQQKDVVP